MKNISTLLLGLVALVLATAALAGPDWDTIQRGRQLAQAQTTSADQQKLTQAQTTSADQQKMLEQCQGMMQMMQNMPMDMHSGNMGMHHGTTMHGMGNPGSRAPAPADNTQLYRGGR